MFFERSLAINTKIFIVFAHRAEKIKAKKTIHQITGFPLKQLFLHRFQCGLCFTVAGKAVSSELKFLYVVL